MDKQKARVDYLEKQVKELNAWMKINDSQIQLLFEQINILKRMIEL